MRVEFNKLYNLKVENISIQKEIDEKIERYKIMINTKMKCLNCDQSLYVENFLTKTSIK